MALVEAARDGDVAEVRRLIASGADLNGAEETVFDCTALHEAAYNGHVDCVRVLVEGGASVDKRDRFGLTPLHWAASRKHCEIVTYLLEKGASVNSMNSFGQTPLHYANSAAVAKELLRWGADPNMRDNDGKTPVDEARTYRETEDVARVLENPSAWMGAGATAPVNEGESGMVIALKYFKENIFLIICATYVLQVRFVLYHRPVLPPYPRGGGLWSWPSLFQGRQTGHRQNWKGSRCEEI